jgi:hypothetical protein
VFIWIQFATAEGTNGEGLWFSKERSIGQKMTAISKDDEVLETANAGLSRVADAIVSMAPEDRKKALAAAEESYCKTALELGFTEPQAHAWAATVMASLRSEMQKQKPSN